MDNSTFERFRFGPLTESPRDDFDFTPIFADTVFSIVPSFLVLGVSVARISYLWNKQQRLKATHLRYAKLLSLALYAGSQLALVVCWLTRVPSPSWTAVLAASLSLASALIFFVLSYLEHARSIKPSSILLLYLFFSMGFDIVRLRVSWLVQSTSVIAKLSIASLVFKAVSLVLEAVEKGHYLPNDFSQYRPEELSSILNKGVFFWLNGLMKAGARTVLVPDVLYKLDSNLSTDKLAPAFITAWQAEKLKQDKHSVLKALFHTLKWQLLRAVFPRLMLLAFTVCQPLLIKKILKYLEHAHTEPAGRGGGLVAAYSLTFFGIAVSKGFYYHAHYRLLTMIRGCLVAALNRQVSRLDIQSVKDPKATLTLMSADVERITAGFRELHEFWANTISIAVVSYLLSTQLGLAALVPIAIALMGAAGVTFTSKAIGPRQKRWMEAVEQRVSLTSSILSSMKEVKMRGLSVVLTQMTQKLRAKELQLAARARVLVMIVGLFAWAPDLLSPAATFIVFYLQAQKSGTTFDSARAFTSLSLIVLLAQQLKRTFTGLSPFVAAFACLQRIEKFMCAEEQKDFRDALPMATHAVSTSSSDFNAETQGTRLSEFDIQEDHSAVASSSNVAIKITDGCFGWNEGKDVLKNLNVAFPAAKLSCVIGPVASGKSTLCKALLGETWASRGRVEVMPGVRNIAFCDQTAYLTNKSIKQNIVGFSLFEQGWYETVIRSTALEEDIAALPDNDETKVGTDGGNLSGGQRHKVALARALYSRKKILLMDDIFSGLDAGSAEHIVRHVLGPQGLMRKHDLTVIFATHTVKFLPLADHVVVINEAGEIDAEGPFPEVRSLSRYVQDLNVDADRQHKDEPEITSKMPVALSKATVSTAEEDRTRQTGDFAVYRFYFRAAGIFSLLILCLIGVAFSASRNVPTLWLNAWADSAMKEHGPGKPLYPAVYTAIQASGLICIAGLFYQGLMVIVTKAGKTLHEISLKTAMNAPLSVFSKTDIGSLTNRFSQDMTLIDAQLAFGILFLPGGLASVMGQAIVIGISSPWALITFPFMLVILYYIQKFYLSTSRQLRFLDIEAKSPLYTHFLESIKGLATLRAFGWAEPNVDVGQELLNQSQRPDYLLHMIQRWLIFVLDTLVASLATIVVIIAIGRRSDSGLTGAALAQLVTFNQWLTYIIIDWTEIETSIGAVSRIKNFSEKTQSEHKPSEIIEPPAEWPSAGAIEFRKLSATYDENATDQLVLKEIDLTIAPGEKIGICGRSGSGKSSLILALLRMLETTEGTIVIDDVNLNTSPRETVRSRFNVLPQHPFFLHGSVRMNLDPAQTHDDTTLTQALRKVGLEDVLLNEQSGTNLDTPFKSESLSHGQRQLFALASAFLRKSQVVILDEVTSNVDRATDTFMQKMIREKFASSTIIAVAHRLDTIIDFDRVVVMSNGRIVEVGKPEDLLKKEGGPFRAMWETG